MSPTNDPFEERLPAALRAGGDVFPDHSPDLVQRGLTRGKRIKRVRNLRISVAAAAAVALIGGGSVFLTGSHGGGDSKNNAGPAATTPPTPENPKPVTAQQMQDLLKGLLPKDAKFTEEEGRGSEASDQLPIELPLATLVLETPKGKTGMMLAVRRVPAGEPVEPPCRQKEVICETGSTANGGTLTAAKSHTYTDVARKAQQEWTVDFSRADGARISVYASGGGKSKESTSTADPVLSIDELKAIAQSPVWDKVVATLPIPPAHVPSPADDYNKPDPKLGDKFKTLLPQGVKFSDINSKKDYAGLVFNDGKGETFVEVNVQKNMGELLKDHFSCPQPDGKTCSVDTTADGRKVLVTQGLAKENGPAVQWTVDTLTADDRRVVVSAYNAKTPTGATTRSAPALTLDQLKEMALSPTWLQ